MNVGTKRPRPDEPYDYPANPSLVSSNSTFNTPSAPTNSGPSSSFRNVSACNRCRLRKNRCDQNLPACTSCEKAGVKCVGFDPITKREIPRTYVYYLESRVRYLEELLSEQDIPFGPSQDFDLGSKPTKDDTTAHSPLSERSSAKENVVKRKRESTGGESGSEWEQKEESDKLNKLVSNIGMVSVQGASDPRFLGSTSGISFARVVFAAVKSSISGGDRSGRGSKPSSVGSAAATGGTSMRDSFFGLQTKPNMKPAPFPDRELGLRLVNLYFEHANPQIPILHRGEFMILFGRAYAVKDRRRSARELYILNIVFAIGAGIILEDSSTKNSPSPGTAGTTPPGLKQEPVSPNQKKQKLSNQQRQAEEYHASAMMHLEPFLGSMSATDRPEGLGGGLEQLQAILLLASFALLRPVAPGLWYITGVAMRLGVDLGLHYEDGAGVDAAEDTSGLAKGHVTTMGGDQPNSDPTGLDPKERGRREWVRDLRRRLWWCVYSFDRLVSTCVGRPFGISDAVITTDWPSVLDDKYITPSGFLIPSHGHSGPSYKRVAHHYFRLRLHQSEILQVLQYRQAQRVHAKDGARKSPFMHTKLSCSFLRPFESFHAWRKDIDRRLWEWKESAPLQEDTTVHFSIKFLELNYWQAVIMLYRQSLSVPPNLAGEVGPHNDVDSPMTANTDSYEDEDEIFLKVAEAGQRVLKLYRQLHRVHLVNYTYLATVHLFMAGIAFLYSIWHSPTVRSRLTLDDVDFTVLAATSVLGDLIDKCPPAEACRDAFERMSKATVKMCVSTTGFGSQVKFAKQRQDDDSPIPAQHKFDQRIPPPSTFSTMSSRPPPEFDYDLKTLFTEDAQNGRMFHRPSQNWQAPLFNIAPNQAPTYAYTPSDASTPPALSTVSTTTNTTANPPQGQTATPNPTNPTFDSSLLPNSFPPSNEISNSGPTTYDNYDFDFLMNNDTTDTNAIFSGDVGANLGFDGQHDWVDGGGQLPDLFGGFFFGPPAGGEGSIDGSGGGFGTGVGGYAEGIWNGGPD